MDVDDLPADGPRATRRLAGRRHRAGGSPSARSRDSAPARRRGDGRARRERGDRGAPSRRGCSGTTTSPVAGGRAEPEPGGTPPDSRRTIAACIGVTTCPARPTCPATSSASSTRSRTRSATNPTGRPRPIEGTGRSGVHGANGRVEAAVHQILIEIGEDPDRQGLVGTPERVHRMYTELTAGYHVDPERLINGAIFDIAYSEMVVVKDIPFYSLCEHHLLPFFGTAAVALHPARPGHRAVEDPAHRRDVRPPAPGPGAADPADRRLPPGAARAAGRRRRPRGDPPVRGHARRPQARDDHDDLVRARAVPDARPDPGRVLRPPRAARARTPERWTSACAIGSCSSPVPVAEPGRPSRRAFAAEGAFVALHHRDGSASRGRGREEAAAEIVAAGGRAMAVGADLTSTRAGRRRWSSGSTPSWGRSACS